MPAIDVKMDSGRTLEQKRSLVALVTEAVVQSLGVTAEAVAIRIFETSGENRAQGGRLVADIARSDRVDTSS